MNKPNPYTEKRPWGWFRRFTGQPPTVKIICVYHGHAISLQSHKLRYEHWYIVSGVFQITVGDEIKEAYPGDEFWIKPGIKHRIQGIGGSLENLEENKLLEISYGEFHENDIERFEDNYGRV
jgi:mannose-6-phosphate isomerase